jgi:cell division protein FtsB
MREIKGFEAKDRGHCSAAFHVAAPITRSTPQSSVGNASLADSAQLDGSHHPAISAGWGTLMSIESLTYADLGGRLGTSPEAARALARRLRLPRTTGNDGKARVTVDLADIQYRPSPTRSPGGHRPDIDALNARIEDLQAELAKLESEKSCIEATAAGHRADFERERERCDTIIAEALKMTKIAMLARATAARLEGELAARQRQPWWKRVVS